MAYLHIVLYTVLQWLMSQCNTRVPGNKLNTTQFLPFWAHLLSFEGSLRDPWRSESPTVQFIFPDRSCSWPIILWNPRGPQNRKKMLISYLFLSHYEPLGAFKGLLGVPIIRYLFVLLSNLGRHKTGISITFGYYKSEKITLLSFYYHRTIFKAQGPCRAL